jgi:WD40 repeat protein
MLSADESNKVRVWNTSNWSQIKLITTSWLNNQFLAWSADEKLLFIASSTTGAINIYNVTNNYALIQQLTVLDIDICGYFYYYPEDKMIFLSGNGGTKSFFSIDTNTFVVDRFLTSFVQPKYVTNFDQYIVIN